MADQQHRATAQQWLGMEVDRGTLDCFAVASTILELRDRIEALEAAAKSNHPAKPDSSLVERVTAAIVGNSEAGVNWKPEARAAIREVAAWLQEQKSYGHGWAAITLEQEAKR